MSYLFLGIPYFCGSTLIHNLIATCPDVAILSYPKDGRKRTGDFVEGDNVAEKYYSSRSSTSVANYIQSNMAHVYSDSNSCDWESVKNLWDKNWEDGFPNATIRLQKSPADIFRVETMLNYFNDVKWVLTVRNPYAYAFQLMSCPFLGFDPMKELDKVCFHILEVMEIQKRNRELLGGDAYTVTYEDFVDKPEYHREQLGLFMSGLEKINFDARFQVKQSMYAGLRNDNEPKIETLIECIPNIINMLNVYFSKKESILNYWGYSLR